MKGLSLFVCAVWSIASFADNSSASTVVQLYKDFAYETVVVAPNLPNLMEQPRPTLEKYFDPKLTDLLLRDRHCVETTNQICRLDFMPLWDAQDVGATDLEVVSTSDPSVVEVTFRFAGAKEKTKLTYQLSKSKAGWRITDIRASSWSLKALLERKE